MGNEGHICCVCVYVCVCARVRARTWPFVVSMPVHVCGRVCVCVSVFRTQMCAWDIKDTYVVPNHMYVQLRTIALIYFCTVIYMGIFTGTHIDILICKYVDI